MVTLTQDEVEQLEEFLDIHPLEKLPRHLKMFIFGPSGVGKTVLSASGAQVPGFTPVLYIDIEGGTESIRDRDGIKRVVVPGQRAFTALQALLRAKHGYNCVVVDNLTELRVQIARWVLQQAIDEDPDHDKEILTMRGWQRVASRVRDFCRLLRDIPCHVIVTTHSTLTKDEITGRLYTRPLLSNTLSVYIPGYFDIVGYLEVGQQMHPETRQPILVRRLSVQPTRERIGKDRSWSLGEYVDSPTMHKIAELAGYIDKEEQHAEAAG